MLIKVKITDSVIEASKGCQKSIFNCLIARAIREIFPFATVFPNWMEGTSEWKIRLNDGPGKLLTLPEIAGKLATDFDKGKKVVPTSFEIDVPNEIIESIGIEEALKIISESKTLECVEA